MSYFRSLHLQLQVLSNEDLKGTRTKHGFKLAFILLFGQDVETFTSVIFLYVDQLEKQLDKDEFQEDDSMDAFWRQEGEVDRVKALDADLVVTKSSRTERENHDTSSKSGNDTHAVDAYIKPVNDKEPMAKVQLTTQHNVLANEQHHTKQSEPIHDTYFLENVDGNTTPNSTNMSNRDGEIDQNAEKCQVTSPLL
ncbi:hypothetical protein Tco_0941806 [Tanacetum coccineum]|uniref:Uncharacterized protein n=1 Tax=Tanacetum coccineum TaxID=301880 RepID=A0ABQ5DUI5_9ASTR